MASAACTCDSSHAGIDCSENITGTFDSDGHFEWSKESSLPYPDSTGKAIYATTASVLKEFGYTNVYANIPDNKELAGGDLQQAVVRSQLMNGGYSKTTFSEDYFTCDTYLPGFSDDYWNGSKDLGSERRLRDRLLALKFAFNNFQIVQGLDEDGYESMADSYPIYVSMVNVSNGALDMSLETQTRGWPLALCIVMPILLVIAILVIIWVAWCLFAPDKDGDEEGDEDQGAINKVFLIYFWLIKFLGN